MITPTFQKLYKQLNRQQKQAVDSIEGPVMVIAGPGTGKTQILTLRIANILRKTDTAPDSILALTFTESGVFSMRKRLVEIIGSAGYRVHIYTFHSFCNDVIRGFPDEFPKIIGSRHLNDVDKISVLKDIIKRSNLKNLKPFGDNFYYLNSIKGKISELKRENISSGKLSTILKKQENDFYNTPDLYHKSGAHKGEMKGKYKNLEKKLGRNKELLRVYKLYENKLKKKRFYDYEDMIMETIKALEKNRDLLLTLQEEYQYILADEHQDANNSQNRLLELLASYHQNPNIFVVGDEKQAIFRFQGASMENFLYFKKLYRRAVLVTLAKNYRSLQHILDSAHSLIEKSEARKKRMREPLTGKRDSKEKIKLRAFSNEEYEYLFIADDIKKKLKMGIEPQEIAVLYRNNSDADIIMQIFEKIGVPFVVESDQNILKDADIQKLIILLRAINDFGDDIYLPPLLHIDFLNTESLDLYKLASYSKRKRIPFFEILSSERHLKNAKVKEKDKLLRLYKKLSSWKKAAENKSVTELIEIVVEESGLLNHLLSGRDAGDKLEKLAGFFNTAKELIENHREYKLPNLISYIDLLEEHNILVKKDSKSVVPKKVRLMTAHKSKGQEFDYVYIVGARDSHWGNKRSVEHFNIPISSVYEDENYEINDERRLFYVALTRARLGVSISYSREGKTGTLQLPSQFIEEIDGKFINEIDTQSFEKSVKKRIAAQA